MSAHDRLAQGAARAEQGHARGAAPFGALGPVQLPTLDQHRQSRPVLSFDDPPTGPIPIVRRDPVDVARQVARDARNRLVEDYVQASNVVEFGSGHAQTEARASLDPLLECLAAIGLIMRALDGETDPRRLSVPARGSRAA